MVQTEWNEQPLEENKYPHAKRTARHDKVLKNLHAVLDIGPDDNRQQRHREHGKKTYHKDKRRTIERTKPFRQVRIKKFIVQIDDNAGNKERAKHTHIHCFDVGNHRQTAGTANVRGKINAKHASPLREYCIHKIVECQVQNERLHTAPRRLLVGQTNWKANNKQQGQLVKHTPRPLKDDIPYQIPHACGRGQRAENGLRRAERANTNHNTCK